LQGVDLEKVTLAMIHAQREGKDMLFQELVEADGRQAGRETGKVSLVVGYDVVFLSPRSMAKNKREIVSKSYVAFARVKR
jgi:hypothetical protein